jgi:DNA-binding CsgD family transcriptional regulator
LTEDRNRSARGEGQGAPLSVREREILGLIAGGDSGAQIAEALVLSPETVRTHIRNAMEKLDARTRTEAVVKALDLGQVQRSPHSA